MRFDMQRKLLVLGIVLGIQASFCSAAEVSGSDNQSTTTEKTKSGTQGGEKQPFSPGNTSYNPGQHGTSGYTPPSRGTPEHTVGGGTRVRRTGREK